MVYFAEQIACISGSSFISFFYHMKPVENSNLSNYQHLSQLDSCYLSNLPTSSSLHKSNPESTNGPLSNPTLRCSHSQFIRLFPQKTSQKSNLCNHPHFPQINIHAPIKPIPPNLTVHCSQTARNKTQIKFIIYPHFPPN